MRHIYFVALFLFALSTSLLGQTIAINSLSQMPSDRTTILMDTSIYPNGFGPLFSNQGIALETWDANYQGWTSCNPYCGWGGASGFYPDPSSPDAPFGTLMVESAVRLTFSDPVYSVGATFFATQYPDINQPGGSFDDNTPNKVYEVRAFDTGGNLIDVAYSNSYSERHGPSHFYVGSASVTFWTSFAGISSHTPIRQVIFWSPVPESGWLLARWGSFSYSRTPLSSWPQSQPLQGAIKRVTTSSTDETGPAISGPRIAYTGTGNSTTNLFLYDLTTNTESLLSSSSGVEHLGSIDGTKMVYAYATANGTDVFVRDIVAGTSSQISFDQQSHDPTISGNYVAWVTGPAGGPMNVMLADLTTQATQKLTADPQYVGLPRIDGDWIVWEEQINGYRQIRAYQISTGQTKQLTSDSAAHRAPDVSGNTVVWADNRSGNFDVYAYDLSTGMSKQVTFESADQQHPRISGNQIVWEDQRTGISQVWSIPSSYSLTPQPVSPSSVAQNLGDIDGTHIVWSEARYGNSDVFLFTIGAQGDTTAPVFGSHPDITTTATSATGAVVSFNITATDDTDPSPTVTCNPATGSAFPIGSTAVNCSATDSSGNIASASFNVHVNYNFVGFFAPINMTIWNTMKAGQAAPLKWQLTTANGTYISDLSAVVLASSGSEPCTAGASDPVESPDTTGSSGLQYDQIANQFVFVWQTAKGWSGTCRRFVLSLKDGNTYTANFAFK